MLHPTAKHEHTGDTRLQTTVERAERSMIYGLTEAARRLHPDGQVATLLLQSGGAAIFAPDSTDYRMKFAFLTRNGLSEQNMRVLENAYVFCDGPVSLFIPTLAPSETFDRLRSRGFSSQGLINVLIGSLNDIMATQPAQLKPSSIVDDMMIAQATPDDYSAFIEYHGGSGDGTSSERLKVTAQIATQISNTTIFLAKLDGRIVAATTVTLLEAASNEVAAYTALTSTLAECRGKGVSTALKRFVHDWLKERGCRWVFAHVEADNSNRRVLEKLGYKVAFTHAVYVKSSGSESC
ncbi:hypothetical protein N7456_002628 [Penicillium angulare]|uniref:N-acetyltransferase domain-containing protein n=1 Tax=Penicillium angulare TaxID=116970 RepID=A0A9W9G8U8_9EURO|nr:hypothetical protein N7456_002628 [Penicillium angulare]